MTVDGVYDKAAVAYDRVIGHDGKIKHHLVDLSVAVAADGDDLFFKRIEHGDDLFGRVAFGQVVSRAMIEHIAEDKYPVGLFTFYRLKKHAAVMGRTVYIGCNEPFHIYISPIILFVTLLYR